MDCEQEKAEGHEVAGTHFVVTEAGREGDEEADDGADGEDGTDLGSGEGDLVEVDAKEKHHRVDEVFDDAVED